MRRLIDWLSLQLWRNQVRALEIRERNLRDYLAEAEAGVGAARSELIRTSARLARARERIVSGALS